MVDNKIVEDISKIDKNLAVQSSLEVKDVVFYDSKKAPFDLYGACKEELDLFRRMPQKFADSLGEGIALLNRHTAGIRVRFSTDSDYIAIKCIMPVVSNAPHIAMTGKSGFDLYQTENGMCTYLKTFVPPKDMTDGYESIAWLNGGKKKRYLEINFPLYNRVNELYIGVREGSFIDCGEKYKFEKPVVYYGGSTTQGACASKPSNCLEAIISHDLDCDHINLGFSGNGLGEKKMAEYIGSIDASVFVCNFDGNVPTAEKLREVYLPFYKTYREKRPDTPIIFAPRTVCKNFYTKDCEIRRQIILDTYNYAIEHGDNNVAFIDGRTVFTGRYENVYTVDGAHPTDAGFLRMAEVFGRQIEIMLRKSK